MKWNKLFDDLSYKDIAELVYMPPKDDGPICKIVSAPKIYQRRNKEDLPGVIYDLLEDDGFISFMKNYTPNAYKMLFDRIVFTNKKSVPIVLNDAWVLNLKIKE